MRLKKYSSDISARSWQGIEKMLVVQRKSKWELQEIINAIFYITKNGCVWRDLPGEFPPWQTVYWYFHKWIKEGTWENISACLTVEYREKKGKMAQPTVAIIDSQSCKNTSTCIAEVGVDGGKLIKGRKRFYVVDTLGCLLESFVVAANRYDGVIAAQRWQVFGRSNILLTNLKKIYADGAFGGRFREQMQQEFNVEVIIPAIPIASKGKVDIHQGRWIVERTIAWMNNNRRCAKDYERKTQTANAFLVIANIRRIAMHN